MEKTGMKLNNNCIIYYKVIEIWYKYPWNQEIDYRYCEFSTSKKNFEKNKLIIKMDSNTTIKNKEDYIKTFYSLNKVTIIKLK